MNLFKFKNKKRGQGAAAAATLLAIIAGLLIMFIILVSPEERQAILDGETLSEEDGSSSASVVEEVLLTENPGRIEYLTLDEIEHSLASVRVYTRSESKIFAERNSLYMKNGIFTQEDATQTFEIDDVSNTEDLILSFKVADVQGVLKISLNGQEIYNFEPEVGESPIVEIPDFLLEEENTLLFEVSSPGVAFWRTNFASIENIKVVGEVTDLDFQTATRTFLVSETEYNNVESLQLEFQPDCDYNEVGALTVSVNDYDIFSGVPDCGLSLTPIEFSSALVYEGENEIRFFTEYEEYQLSHIKVVSQLEDIDYTTYFFDLTLEQEEAISNGDKEVKVVIEFTDDSSDKTGYISVNGDKSHFDTREISEIIDISEDVVQGNNAIMIKPSKTITIREFNVELRDS